MHGNGPISDYSSREIAHRLHPNGVTQVRKCINDTILPCGGGRDGKSPIHVRKGDVVQVNKNVLHRDPDI